MGVIGGEKITRIESTGGVVDVRPTIGGVVGTVNGWSGDTVDVFSIIFSNKLDESVTILMTWSVEDIRDDRSWWQIGLWRIYIYSNWKNLKSKRFFMSIL